MFFDKPFDALTIDDVKWLVQSEIPESTDLEYKRELPGEKGSPDSWQSGSNKIGRTAIGAIVKELVAFANAGGGFLLIGVGESDGKPARAASINPVRSAHELAERLKRTCRDNIEPGIFGLDARALTDDKAGDGVVVVRVAESPYGPHRSRCDRECYVRKNEDSVPMTMDEIHRRVIDMSRRLDRIDEWFAGQRPPSMTDDGWVIKAAARPTGPFQLPGLHRTQAARPVIRPILVRSTRGKGQGWKAAMSTDALNWRPIVRGTRCFEAYYNGWTTDLRVHEDGSIIFEWRGRGPFKDREKVLYMNWFIAMFGNMLLAAERIRLVTNNPVDYSAEVYVGVHGDMLTRLPYWDEWHGSSGGFEPGVSTLGRYPIGDPSTFAEISKIFETDVCHLAGAEATDITYFDYDKDLSALRDQFGIAA